MRIRATMSTAAGQPARPQRLPVRAWRRRARAVALGAAVLVGLALAGLLWRRYAAPAPPAVSFADVDPEVARAVEAAREEVRRRPYSAAAWGRLGQVLHAHRYQAEADLCFAHAERLDPDDPRWPYLQGLDLRHDDPEAAVRHLERAVARAGGRTEAPELCLAEAGLQLDRLE